MWVVVGGAVKSGWLPRFSQPLTLTLTLSQNRLYGATSYCDPGLFDEAQSMLSIHHRASEWQQHSRAVNVQDLESCLPDYFLRHRHQKVQWKTPAGRHLPQSKAAATDVMDCRDPVDDRPNWRCTFQRRTPAICDMQLCVLNICLGLWSRIWEAPCSLHPGLLDLRLSGSS